MIQIIYGYVQILVTVAEATNLKKIKCKSCLVGFINEKTII